MSAAAVDVNCGSMEDLGCMRGGAGVRSRAARVVVLGLVVALGLLWLGVTVARAAVAGQSYGDTGTIGTPDTGDWGLNGNFSPVAVSRDDGNVFIIRQLEYALDVLTPGGTSIVRPGLSITPASVAASADGSVLFAVDAFTGTVVKVTSDGAPTPAYAQDPVWAPSAALNVVGGIAIDPVTGDLVVAASGGIYRFDAGSGQLLSSFDGSASEGGAFSVRGIAIAPNRDIYVAAGPGRVEHMGFDGSWKGALDVPMPENNTAPYGIAVNPQNGDVAVELAQGADTVIKLYSAANALKDSIVVPG